MQVEIKNYLKNLTGTEAKKYSLWISIQTKNKQKIEKN